MSRTFTLTFNVPDEMTIDDLTRTIGYVAEHFFAGRTSAQRAMETPANITGTVWAGHGGILGTFTLAPRQSDAPVEPDDDAAAEREAARKLRETMQQLVDGLDKARDATRGVIDALGQVIAAEEEGAPYVGRRFIGEIVELTRDCEIGRAGERATVTELSGGRYPAMTLIFDFVDDGTTRTIRTGADYKFLRPARDNGKRVTPRPSCDECGAAVPSNARSHAGAYHAESCSLYDAGAVS